MSLLLASVRTVNEARIALAGGVDWLDVKDPLAGALGRADDTVIRAIVDLASGRVPVSATAGETWDAPEAIPDAVAALAATGVDYVKVGLRAQSIGRASLDALEAACAPGRRVIVVCMAEAPPTVADITALAGTGIVGVMLDTADKAGPGLSGLIAPAALATFVAQARTLRLMTGLAGKLTRADIDTLVPCGADYLGFRSALCVAGERRSELSATAVAAVRAALPAAVRAAAG